MLRVLVTGATGFVGRRLCGHLASLGWIVRGTFRSTPPSAQEGMEWVQIGDIGPDTDWDRALEGVDRVVHLAGLAHQVGKSDLLLAKEYDRINVGGTARLAEAVLKHPQVRRLVFISSTAAVATTHEEIIHGQTPCRPEQAYGRSKLQAEKALQNAFKNREADWVILRPCLIYGPGHTGNLQRIERLLRSGLPIPLGGIQNRRSLIFLDNFTQAIGLSLDAQAASRRTLLIADPVSFSTPDLLRAIANATGCPARLVPCPVFLLRLLAKLGDGCNRLLGFSPGLDTPSLNRLFGSLEVDSSEAMEALGWEPEHPAEAGFRITFRP